MHTAGNGGCSPGLNIPSFLSKQTRRGARKLVWGLTAVLLVDPDYHPFPTTDVAPIQGGPISLVTIVKGVGVPQLAPVGSLKFSGYDWRIRMASSDKGGTNNLYDPGNASTDATGSLHMQIKRKSDNWSCAEIFLNRSIG